MVTFSDALNRVKADPLANEQTNDVRVAWVLDYRQNHPEAQRWAEGIWSIEHSIETQERVFRMAEQLAARGIHRGAVFAALRRADRVVYAAGRGLSQVDGRARHLYFEGRSVRWEDLPSGPWRASLAAADAGCAVIDRLLGEHGTVVSLLRAAAFEDHLGRDRHWVPQAQAGRLMIMVAEAPPLDQLYACGFDPVLFDGADPAAFAWAIFELGRRSEATLNELRCDCHPSVRPLPLGVAGNQ